MRDSLSDHLLAYRQRITRANSTTKIIDRLRKNARLRLLFQSGLGVGWMMVFLFAPLIYVFMLSFMQSDPFGEIIYEQTLDNYRSVLLEDASWLSMDFSNLFLLIFWQSFKFAAITTIAVLVLGYTLAYYIARKVTPEYKLLLLILVILPFWVPVIVRYYGWVHVIGNDGVLVTALSWVGVETNGWMYTTAAVISGMIQVFLPFMILPIYQSIENINDDLLESAQSLGASPLRTFYEVTLPLSLPGVSAGVILVFILSIGTFLAPPILGGPGDIMIANMITNTFRQLSDWPLASAMSIFYLVFLFVVITLFNRQMDLESVFGGGENDG